MRRAIAIAFCLCSLFEASTAWAVDQARLAVLQRSLNPALREPYRLGPAIGPEGSQVAVMRSLHDHRRAIEYTKQVDEMREAPEVFGARLASLGLLALTGAPAMENLGTVLFSTTDQLPVVAGLNVVYGAVNQGRIERIEGTITFDGHIHSGRSHDGGDSYESIILEAVKKGLDAIAITDHNEFDYPRQLEVLRRLKQEGRVPQDFLLIPGEEISSVDGHILAYFIDRKIEPYLSADETIRAIHAQGGVAVAPHPSGSGGVGMSVATSLDFDGVEIMSGANMLPLGMIRDRRGEADLDGRFAMANSDGHAHTAVGVMYTRVHVKERSLDGVRSAMLAARTRAVSENEHYVNYTATIMPTAEVVLWPLLTYMKYKGDLLTAMAEALALDRISFTTSWEYVVFRVADGIFIPTEAVRLANGSSELLEPIRIRSASATKGPLRLSYEMFDFLGYSRREPVWKLEARLNF